MFKKKPTTSKRERKPSSKKLEQEPAVQPEKSIWCTVELEHQDGSKKEDLVCSKYLETESGEPVTLKDLYFESRVIWMHKGIPYEATVLEMHRKKPVTKSKNSARVTVESESDEDIQRPVGKIRNNVLADSDSEGDIAKPPCSKKKKTMKMPEDDKADSTANQSQSFNGYDEKDMLIESDIENYDHEEEICDDILTPPNQQKVSKITSRCEGFKIPFGGSSSRSTATPQLPARNATSLNDQLCRIEEKLDHILKCLKKTASTPASQATQQESKFVMENGVNLLAVRAVDPAKYALQLMDVLFTDEEMASSCYTPSQRSKKNGLDPERISLLEECVRKRFSEKEYQEYSHTIKRKGTQKCIDKSRAILKKEN